MTKRDKKKQSKIDKKTSGSMHETLPDLVTLSASITPEQYIEGLLDLGITAGLANLSRQWSSALGTSDRANRYVCAGVYAAAQSLEGDAHEWKKFCEDPFWQGLNRPPKQKDQPEALHFAVRRAIGGTDANSRKTVSRYSTALRQLKADGIKPADVPQAIIDEGGIEVLKRKFATAKKGEQPVIARKPAGTIVAFGVLARQLFTPGITGRYKVEFEITKSAGGRIQAERFKKVKKIG